MQNKKVIVVGAGAAGVMAAGAAAENCADVLLLERNPKIGRKVLITGKGRCNVTHHTDEIDTLIQNIPGNGRFLYSAFSQFMPQDTVDFFEDYGVPLKVERGNRVFPQSDRAADIVDALSGGRRRNRATGARNRIADGKRRGERDKNRKRRMYFCRQRHFGDRRQILPENGFDRGRICFGAKRRTHGNTPASLFVGASLPRGFLQ